MSGLASVNDEENMDEDKDRPSSTSPEDPEPSGYRWSVDEYDAVETGSGNERESPGGSASPDANMEPEEEDENGEELEEDDEQEQQQEESEPPERILEKSLKLFSTPDFIMEPEVFNSLSQYFQIGGEPGVVIDLLSNNYVAMSQICNIMTDWLAILGCNSNEINSIFETHLQNLIIKYFDPKKADLIFNQQAEGQIDWLPEVITFTPWRSLIYRLSERYPECLMLNFAIKLISDAGYQNEISGVTTATQQLDIFSRVFCSAVNNVLMHNVDSLNYRNAMNELAKIVSHGEHTYLYTQALLFCLAQEPKGGSAATRIAQELRETFRKNAPETIDIALALHNSQSSPCNPSIIQAMHSMLTRNSLNPADISLLYNYYNHNEPPPVEIIRDTVFLDMLIDTLFKPKAKLNVDHRPKYIYLLAYAASVPENSRKGQRKQHCREEVKTTQQAIEKAQYILSECSGSSLDLPLTDLQTMFQCLRYPVVAAGVLHWVKCVVADVDYFRLHPEPLPINLALVDEITSLHPLLHDRVFAVLIGLFEMEQDGVDVLVQLDRRRMFIDRLVHLLSAGYALPVTNYMKQKLLKNDADVSLIRYFVTETLEIIAPPYSSEFTDNFLPLVENSDISRRETMSEDKWEAIQLFITQCKA